MRHGEGCTTSSFTMVTKATVDAKRKNAAKRLRNVYAASSKIAAGTREKDVAARNATRIPARNAGAEGDRKGTDVAESQRREEVRTSPRSRLRTRAHGRPLTSGADSLASARSSLQGLDRVGREGLTTWHDNDVTRSTLCTTLPHRLDLGSIRPLGRQDRR